MSQKELNYLEDIYNHEILMVNIITCTMERIEDENYLEMLEEHARKHDALAKKVLNLLEGMC